MNLLKFFSDYPFLIHRLPQKGNLPQVKKHCYNCCTVSIFVAGVIWTILVLTLMEDGFKEWNSVGVNAFRRRQSRYQSSSSNSRIPRGSSEAMATKLGPSFHTQPPTKYSFSNDTGKRSFAYLDIELLCLGVK